VIPAMPICRAILALSFLFSTCAFAGSALPDTPAGTLLQAWIDAFDSGDETRIREFDEAHSPEMKPLEETMAWRDQTGGFTLLSVEKSEPLSITALLREKDSEWAARVTLSLRPDDASKIAKLVFAGMPVPREYAQARMTEPEALAALSAHVDELAHKDFFSGSVLIARRGKILLQRAWGFADREAKTPNTIETQFRIGSMNKMFTAIATLQLVEAGKLALDEPVGTYLPDYPNKDIAAKVTVRHLLTHTGGTGDIFGPEFDANRDTLKEHADYLKLYGTRGPDQVPGTEFEYSNYGFVLLGALIEKVTGRSYYDYVRDKIFAPAGMHATDSLPESVAVPMRAKGYMRVHRAWVSNVDTLPYRGTAAGGGYSTVGDLLRFAGALESGKLLSKTLFAEATRSQKGPYGFGFIVDGDGASRMYGHDGGAPGINGSLRIFPTSGYVLIALSNLDPPAADRPLGYFEVRMPLNR